VDQGIGDVDPAQRRIEAGAIGYVARNHLCEWSHTTLENGWMSGDTANAMAACLEMLQETPADITGGTGQQDQSCLGEALGVLENCLPQRGGLTAADVGVGV
jgi:hypothetical protein